MPPINENQLSKKRAAAKARKEKERARKGEAAAAAADVAPAPAAKKRNKDPPKQFRRDWAAMKASLIYDERGVGRTPDGNWAYFPVAGPASEKALPARHGDEKLRWISLAFVEEGEGGREMVAGSSDEENEGGEGEGEEGEDQDTGRNRRRGPSGRGRWRIGMEWRWRYVGRGGGVCGGNGVVGRDCAVRGGEGGEGRDDCLWATRHSTNEVFTRWTSKFPESPSAIRPL